MLTKQFLTAGSAIATIKSLEYNKHYTFKFSKVPNGSKLFIKVLTGPDTWTYLGMCDPERKFYVFPTQASVFKRGTAVWKAVEILTTMVYSGVELPGYKIYHEGKCGKCGRALTQPESIESGLGPICAAKLNGE